MNAQHRLNLAQIATNILAKGTDEEIQIFTTYLDLGVKSVQDLMRRKQAEKVALLKQKEELEKAKQEAKKKPAPKKSTPKKKTVVKSVKKEDVKESIQGGMKRREKEEAKQSTGKTDLKVN
jgi:malic enzyme